DNCFNGMGVPSIVTLGTTTSFEYHRTQEFLCYTPDTSLLSGPFSSTQYELKDAEENNCDQNRAAPSPPYTLEDYLSVTDSLDMVGNIYSMEWEKLQERKDWIIIELLRDYLTRRDLGSAFYLLDLENTTAAKMKKFGIQMHYGLYQEARLTLQAFSHTIPEMVHFKRIQSINIDRLEVGMDYELLTEDKIYLDSLARTELGVRAYAQSILTFMTGAFFPETVDVPHTERLGRPPITIPAIRIFPNPNSGTFILDLGQEAEGEKVEVFSLSGTKIWEDDLEDQVHKMQLEQLPSGVYWLRILDSNLDPIHMQKLMINR
ncbi:MAG: T9SS type A sorting domain-containing protein, partial [Bacteroidota bacterium]